MRRFGRVVAGGALAVLVAFGLAEVVLRLVPPADRREPLPDRPGAYRVLILGDDVSAGVGVPADRAYPRQLEAELVAGGRDVEVVTLARPGWSTDQEVRALERSIARVEPDLVVLQSGGDDLAEMHPQRLWQARPVRRFFVQLDANGGLRWREVAAAPAPAALWQRSRVARAASRWLRRGETDSDGADRYRADETAIANLKRALFLSDQHELVRWLGATQGDDLTRVEIESRVAAAGIDDPGVVLRAVALDPGRVPIRGSPAAWEDDGEHPLWQLYFALVDHAHGIARDAGARLALYCQDDDAAYAWESDHLRRFDTARMRAAYRARCERIAAFARERGLGFIPNREPIERQHRRPLPNVAGHAAIAASFASYLRRQLDGRADPAPAAVPDPDRGGDDLDVDLVWRDPATGAAAAWSVEAASVRLSSRLAAVDEPWSVRGLSDGDGDGDEDVFWRHRHTAETAVWTMRHGRRACTAFVTPPTPAWGLAAAADFDGDGGAELLWRHRWEPRVRLGRSELHPGLGANFRFGAAGDVDGDGRDDVLWLTGAGEVRAWLMRACGRYTWRRLPARAPPAAELVAAVDVDGDGDGDLVWRSAGSWGLWRLGGLDGGDCADLSGKLDGPMTTTSRGTVELGDSTLYYELSGDGPDVVLIHAGIADHRMWDAQMPALVPGHRVLRYDVRGYGRSPNPAGAYVDARDLGELLRHLGIERATLVGASNGGRIALDFALLHPEAVRGLVVIGSSLGGVAPSDDIERRWAEVDAAHGRGELERAVDLTLRMWVDGPHRQPGEVDPAVRAKVADMLRHLYAIPDELDAGEEQPLVPVASDRLGEIRAPLLVLVGDRDFDQKLAVARRLETEVAGARRAVLAGTAHLPSMERPDEVNRLLVEFLAEVETGAP